MKAHIREEKKTTTLELGEGTLLQEKDCKDGVRDESCRAYQQTKRNRIRREY